MNGTDLIISASVTVGPHSYNCSIYPLQWGLGFRRYSNPIRIRALWIGPLCVSVQRSPEVNEDRT